MPYVNKQNPKLPWMGQVLVNGKLKRKGHKTKKAAQEWEVGERKKLLLLTDTVSLGEWAIRYLDYSKKQYIHKTYQEKTAAFKRLFQRSDVEPGLPVCRLTPAIALDYIQVQEAARSGNAANRDRKNLKAAWVWGVKFLNLPIESPFDRVERRATTKKPRYVPPVEDFWKVYDAADCSQDRNMLLAYLHTAARRCEIFRLEWQRDIDFFSKKLQLWSRKNRQGEWEAAWLPMTEELEQALKEQHRATGGGKYVFVNRQSGLPYEYRNKAMKRLCGLAGVKRFGFHAIRHLTASVLAGLDIPIIEIQEILRHKQLSTTDGYIRSLKKNGREAVKSLPGPDDRTEKDYSQEYSQAPSAHLKNSAK
jgi:integrase